MRFVQLPSCKSASANKRGFIGWLEGVRVADAMALTLAASGTVERSAQLFYSGGRTALYTHRPPHAG
jgi:hypothetical protein